jgi:hypothetical protein
VQNLEMQLLASPVNREPLITSGALPWCATLLQQLISELSEKTVCAVWEGGIEYRLWLEIQSPPVIKKHRHYSGSDAVLVTRIKELSDLIDGWILLLDTSGESYLYMPAFIWEHHCLIMQSEDYGNDLKAIQATRTSYGHGDLGDLSEAELRIWASDEAAPGSDFETVAVRRTRAAYAAYFAWRDTLG